MVLSGIWERTKSLVESGDLDAVIERTLDEKDEKAFIHMENESNTYSVKKLLSFNPLRVARQIHITREARKNKYGPKCYVPSMMEEIESITKILDTCRSKDPLISGWEKSAATSSSGEVDILSSDLTHKTSSRIDYIDSQKERQRARLIKKVEVICVGEH